MLSYEKRILRFNALNVSLSTFLGLKNAVPYTLELAPWGDDIFVGLLHGVLFYEYEFIRGGLKMFSW